MTIDTGISAHDLQRVAAVNTHVEIDTAAADMSALSRVTAAEKSVALQELWRNTTPDERARMIGGLSELELNSLGGADDPRRASLDHVLHVLAQRLKPGVVDRTIHTVNATLLGGRSVIQAIIDGAHIEAEARILASFDYR